MKGYFQGIWLEDITVYAHLNTLARHVKVCPQIKLYLGVLYGNSFTSLKCRSLVLFKKIRPKSKTLFLNLQVVEKESESCSIDCFGLKLFLASDISSNAPI